MVEGAEPWCDANPGAGPPIGTGAGGAGAVEAELLDDVPVAGAVGAVAVVLPLADLLPALIAAELAAAPDRGLGSKGGCSIGLPPVGRTVFMV
jgi:hypothetical protein